MKRVFTGRFLGVIRDGAAYSFSWFVILILIISAVSGKHDIGIDFLCRLLGFCLFSSAVFAVFFSDCFLVNKSFLTRLSGFFAVFLPTEIGFLYMSGILSGAGTIWEWVIFVGIVVVLYLICVFLDMTFYRKKGQEYTSQLDRYKEKRRDET